MAGHDPLSSGYGGQMRASVYLLRFALGSCIAAVIGLSISSYELAARPDAVFIHDRPTNPMPGFETPGRMIVLMVVALVITLRIDYKNRIPLWNLVAVLFAGGAISNIAGFYLWGGVVDFLPLGKLYFSPGDVMLISGMLLSCVGCCFYREYTPLRLPSLLRPPRSPRRRSRRWARSL